MKAIISGLGALGFLGWSLAGGSGGPDVTRLVERPPLLVYDEIARLFPATSTSSQGTASDGSYHELKIDVRRSLDQALEYRFTLDGREVLAMTLDFEAAEGGRATRITGELEMEQDLVRFAAAQSGGEAKHVPDFAVDYAMKEMVDTMADAMEADKPLTRDMLFPLLNVSR